MRRRLQIERTIAGLRSTVHEARAQGRAIGLIPTMGALHAGHVSLVANALQRGDAPIVSIFVNPTQFGPDEDFAKYPRDEASDLAALDAAGAAAVFAPGVKEMYPEPPLTTIQVAGLTDGLCGPFRPGHFEGVATVVAKLFLACLPDRAYFGEKDFQQLQVIGRMTRDLNLPVDVVGCPTIRESDGLAMSSRNRYLSARERAAAPAMYRVLLALAEEARGGASLAAAQERAKQALAAAGFGAVDYVSIVDATTLAPIEQVKGAARALAAAWLGKARLIDNVAV